MDNDSTAGSYLIVKRFPYEEPYHTQLEFKASNGLFTGRVDMYCNVSDLSEIGQALRLFPKQVGDEYCYSYGSNDPTDRYYCYFALKFYTIDSRGHCAVQFTVNLNQCEPEEGSCTFSIKAEPAAIGRLGELFETFATLQHLELHWSPSDGRLFKEYQSSVSLPGIAV